MPDQSDLISVFKEFRAALDSYWENDADDDDGSLRERLIRLRPALVRAIERLNIRPVRRLSRAAGRRGRQITVTRDVNVVDAVTEYSYMRSVENRQRVRDFLIEAEETSRLPVPQPEQPRQHKPAQLGTIVVRPFFGPPHPHKLDVFVLMPFRVEMNPIYRDHIVRVCESMELVVKRADDLFGPRPVMADVWGSIAAARVVIADCTTKNPNVFYEIGIAHTIGKPTVLITQSGDDVPSDLKHIRYIEYDYTPPGMSRFEASLEKMLADVLGR